MLKSMTGFGRCEMADDKNRIVVEMKSVNHRYLDLGLKMPKKFNPFEAGIRAQLKDDISRGKVDIFITCEELTESSGKLNYNEALAREYMAAFAKIRESFGMRDEIRVMDLARMPEVLTLEQAEEDEEALWQLLSKALKGATEQFIAQRAREGEHLKEDLLAKLDDILSWIAFIEEKSPETVTRYQEKLEQKVNELLGENHSVDEARILTEVALFADKICVDEETVRLRGHVKAMKEALLSGGNIGRKLDFIAQEMNREANTILSKANDMEISQKAIDLKTEIEKIREQIQNIE